MENNFCWKPFKNSVLDWKCLCWCWTKLLIWQSYRQLKTRFYNVKCSTTFIRSLDTSTNDNIILFKQVLSYFPLLQCIFCLYIAANPVFLQIYTKVVEIHWFWSPLCQRCQPASTTYYIFKQAPLCSLPWWLSHTRGDPHQHPLNYFIVLKLLFAVLPTENLVSVSRAGLLRLMCIMLIAIFLFPWAFPVYCVHPLFLDLDLDCKLLEAQTIFFVMCLCSS